MGPRGTGAGAQLDVCQQQGHVQGRRHLRDSALYCCSSRRVCFILSEEQLPEHPANKVCNYSHAWETPVQTLRRKLVSLSWFRISRGRTGRCGRHGVHPRTNHLWSEVLVGVCEQLGAGPARPGEAVGYAQARGGQVVWGSTLACRTGPQRSSQSLLCLPGLRSFILLNKKIFLLW